MRSSLILPLVCLATLVAGCGGDEKSSSEGSGSGSGSDSSSTSGKLPENMCKAVAPAVPKDWGLTKTFATKSMAKTNCNLADETGRTTLAVGVQQPKSGSRLPTFKKFCDFFVPMAQEQDDKQCTQTGPIKLGGAPAQLQRGVRLDDPPSFLILSFRTNKADIAADVEDVLGDVEDAVSGN